MDLDSVEGYTPGYTLETAMIETRIHRVGNSAVMTLTTEMLAMLDAKVGDTLFVLCGDDGSLRVMAHDPEVAPARETSAAAASPGSASSISTPPSAHE